VVILLPAALLVVGVLLVTRESGASWEHADWPADPTDPGDGA
jgi:hypothetical protein